MTTESDGRNNRPDCVLEDQLELLYRQLPIAIIGTWGCAALVTLVASLGGVEDRAPIIYWFALFTVLSVFRGLDRALYNNARPVEPAAKKWFNRHALGAFISGILWGSAAAYLFLMGGPVLKILVVIVPAGLVAASVPAYSPSFKGFIAYSLPALIPLAAVCFHLGGAIYMALGTSIILYVGLMSGLTFRINKMITGHMRMSMDYARLAERLSNEKNLVESLNKGLKAEVVTRRATEEALTRATAEMKSLLEFNNSILENSPAGILNLDEKLRVVYMNPELKRIIGVPEGEEYYAMGVKMSEIPTIVNAGLTWVLDRLADGAPVSLETPFTSRYGKGAFISIKGVPIMMDGAFAGAMILVVDITSAKNAEGAIIKAREAAERASRAKSEFMANISHELRTPLNSVIGMAGLALNSRSDKERVEQLEIIRSSADALLSMVDDILDFSQIESGEYRLERKSFALVNELEKAIKGPALEAQKKGLEFIVNTEPDLPGLVSGDAAALRNVIKNLAGNAVKFTERGEILVSVSTLTRGDGKKVIGFSVRDTGIGISAESLESIFESFYQVDGSCTRRRGGAGLGATMARKLVEIMGGRLWVDSAQGQGSDFKFEIPMETASEEEKPRAGLKDGLRVVALHPSAKVMASITGHLRHWGLSVAECLTMDEAMLAVNGNGRDTALIVDLGHGTERSAAMLGKLKERSPSLCVVALVTLAEASDIALKMEPGLVDAYLPKPVIHNRLYEALLRATGANRIKEEAKPAPANGGAKGSPHLNVLVAEDNPFNQKLALLILEGKGHKAHVAETGRQAVEMWREGDYDLILMDVQMPEMDGFQATATIREIEKESGARIPICAVTAHVMPGYMEKCLEAGMDDYVTKPINSDELFNKMRKLVESCAGKPHAAPPSPAPEPELGPGRKPLFDISSLRPVFSTDEIQELARVFINRGYEQIASIEKAISERDSKNLCLMAHQLKGSSSQFYALKVVAIAKELEILGHTGNFEEAAQNQFESTGEILHLRSE
ncbi:MAG: response regulator [Nitrospinae bacterium]|nr:response regulator [Nitrospinota bacterium]